MYKKTVRINGIPVTDHVIVIPAQPSKTLMYAAEELKEHLDKAFEKDFSIITDDMPQNPAEILIGNTNRYSAPNDMGIEEYEIFADKGFLSLCGGGQRGTLYAVYAYLEEYVGWRWYAADTTVLRPEAARDIYSGEKIRNKPFLEHREVLFWDPCHDPIFKVRSRLNASLPDAVAEKTGGTMAYCAFVHTLDRLIPHEIYFKDHPEYYALTKDGRQTTQPCLSNPDELEIVTKNALELLRKSNKTFISISQNDNCTYCECPECKKTDEEEGSPAGTLLRFVNNVADAIAKEFPDVRVDTLAYQYTRALPKISRPAPNVTIRLCSIECCFRHPIDDTTVQENAAFCTDIKNWSSICDKLYIWDYCTNFKHYSMPQPNYDVLRRNMKFFADHNVKGMLSQGNYNGKGADLNELKVYLLSKLQWNPYMSEAEYRYHMQDFLEGYYGDGWRYISEYIDILLDDTYGIYFGCFVDQNQLKNFLPHADDVLAAFEKAREMAKTDWQKDHVYKSSLSVLNAKVSILCNKYKDTDKEKFQEAMDLKRKYLEGFFKFDLQSCEWRKTAATIDEELEIERM